MERRDCSEQMDKGTEKEMRTESTTLDGFNKKSVGVRIFLLKGVLEHLASICDDTGASISTVANAALKVALNYPELIEADIRDVKGQHESRKV